MKLHAEFKQKVLELMQKYGIKYKEMDAVSHVLGTAGASSAHQAELYEIALHGDWDESGWTGLRSFLYYC